MDIAALKKKLSSLTGEGNPGIFKPEEGDQTIRIVPLKGAEIPFQELYFHYNLIPKKTILSPLSYGERDPIAEFKDALLSGGRVSKEEFKMIMQKFNPQIRTYAPVIVRGKESEGIKFWAFGQLTYKEILSIISDDEYGDISDVDKGFDLKITFTPASGNATGYASTKVLPKRQSSVLTKDETLKDKWLNNQPDLMEVTGYTRYTFEQLKEILNKVTQETTDDGAQLNVSNEAESPTLVKSNGNSETLPTDVADEFDKLFNTES